MDCLGTVACTVRTLELRAYFPNVYTVFLGIGSHEWCRKAANNCANFRCANGTQEDHGRKVSSSTYVMIESIQNLNFRCAYSKQNIWVWVGHQVLKSGQVGLRDKNLGHGTVFVRFIWPIFWVDLVWVGHQAPTLGHIGFIWCINVFYINYLFLCFSRWQKF